MKKFMLAAGVALAVRATAAAYPSLITEEQNRLPSATSQSIDSDIRLRG
ncbi:MAG: hypothetical protein JO102_07420, partial [Elusimicrobia bacterium]|nr:hypothetical protein [Elusimicrobiota bacterium]